MAQKEYQLQSYGGDLIITGQGLDTQTVETIKAGLPPETLARVIGWRSSAARGQA